MRITARSGRRVLAAAVLASLVSVALQARDWRDIPFTLQELVWEKVNIRKDHPRFLVAKEDLPELKKRWGDKKSWGGGTEAALGYLLTGDKELARKALGSLKQQGEWASRCMIYDWCWEAMTPEERQANTAWMAEQYGLTKEGFPKFGYYVKPELPLPSTVGGMGTGYYNWTFHTEDWCDYGQTGPERYSPMFVLAHEHPKGVEGCQKLWEMSHKDPALLMDYLRDGVHWEGGYYHGRGKQLKMANVFRAWKTATAGQIDYWSKDKCPYIANMGMWHLYQTDFSRKCRTQPSGCHGGWRGGPSWQMSHNMIGTQGAAQSPYYQWFIKHVTGSRDNIYTYLYYDPRLEEKHPKDGLPLARWFAGNRSPIFRSSWDAKNVAIASTYAGFCTCIHDAHDPGHIFYYRNGELMIGQNYYYGPYMKPGGNHNTLMIENDQHMGIKSRGQLRTWRFSQQAIALKAKEYLNGEGLAFETHAGWSYCAVNVSGGYPEAKLKEYLRQIVFLRDGTMVVFDRVETVRKEQMKRMAWHVLAKPQQEGSTLRVECGEAGTLVMQILLPKAFTPHLTVQKGKGREQGHCLNRVEIEATEAAARQLFLTVIHGESGTKAPKATLVEEGGKVGCRLIGEGYAARLLFLPEGDRVGGHITITGEKLGVADQDLTEKIQPNAGGPCD